MYKPSHLQDIQSYEDMTNEAVMVLESNATVLTSLREHYESLLENKDFPIRDAVRENVLEFGRQLQDAVHMTHTHVSRAKLLIRIASDRKHLVSILVQCFNASVCLPAQVLSHMQSQATEKMEILTKNMYEMGIAAQREAVTMRIITIVTLIYLPATFVSVCMRMINWFWQD